MALRGSDLVEGAARPGLVVAAGGGPMHAFAIDEHERILVFDNAGESGQPRYASPNFPPPCDAALSGAWKPWRGKKPRATLPGDHP